MEKYIHKVFYFETDKMGMVHHSNYIRWMEEARLHFLEQLGHGYRKMEDDGIISPVLSVECEYKSPTTFGDEVAIEIQVLEYTGVRLTIGYVMTNVKNNELVLTGTSRHAFLDELRRPVILKKYFPDLDKKLKLLVIKK